MKIGLAAGLMFAATCFAACSEIHAQEPDAYELAAPCRQAGQRAIATVSGATTGTAYDTVLAELKQTVDAFVEKTGESEDASLHCLNSFGATLLHLGERAAASVVYRRATEIARRANGDDDDSTLTMQGNLAVALTGMGALEEAARLQEETLARREKLDGTPAAHKLAITLINLATVQSARGELVKSREWAERGWVLAQKYISPTDRRMGTVLHNYGLVLDRVGLRSAAQQLFERSLTARLEGGDAEGAIDTLASLAASFFDVGRFDESDQRYGEAYDIAQKALPPLHPVRAEIAKSWCRVLSAVGKPDESLRKCDEAIQILQARGEQSKTDVYLTQVNRGITLVQLGRAPEAVESLRGAVRGLRETLPPNSPELLEAVRALGVVLVDAGNVEDGANLLAASFREQKALLGELHPDVLLAQGNYGVVLAMRGELREAESVLADYAAKADTMRGLYGRDERTTRGVFSRFATTRMFLAKLLIAQGRCQEAFDWIENTKARSLLDRLRDRASIDAATDADRERFGSLEQARTRLYVERAGAVGDGSRQTEIDGRLRALDDQIGKLVKAVREKQVASGGTETPSSAILKRGVAANTTIASFGLADDEVLLVSYRKEAGFRCTSLERWSGLADTVLATRALQSTPGGLAGLLAGTASTPARRLIRTGARSFAVLARSAPIPNGATAVSSDSELLNAIGHELLSWLVSSAGATSRLVVSADGVLNLIALDAFPVDGRALVSRFSISQVVSFAGSPGKETRARPQRTKESMIAFGDPVYGPPDATTSATDSARSAALIIRGTLDATTADWPRLPASALELRALSSMFGLIPGKSLFTKDMANTPNLKALNSSGELGKARYLVFSAHALADLADPELSSIVLSLPAGGTQRDAYFTATEMAALELRSDLVFFSACDTGYGQVVSGEGVLGLSAGALIAGARSTVHTLWSVVDSASAEFTTRFFAEVRKGVPPEEALTRTKRAFAKEPQHASPAYWAPYVLIQAQR